MSQTQYRKPEPYRAPEWASGLAVVPKTRIPVSCTLTTAGDCVRDSCIIIRIAHHGPDSNPPLGCAWCPQSILSEGQER